MSTQLVLGVAGAVALGPLGLGLTSASTGFIIGSTIGGIVSQPSAPGPGDLSAPTVEQGTTLPRTYGTTRLTLHPQWVSELRSVANDTGGKGGPPEGSAGYSYFADVVGVIAQRTEIEVIAITRVWVNKKLVATYHSDSTLLSIAASLALEQYDSIELLPGGPAQVPPATYENAVGAADAVGWRNVVSVAIDNLHLGGSKALPLVEVEVITQGTDIGATLPETYTFEGRAFSNDSDAYTSDDYYRPTGDWRFDVDDYHITTPLVGSGDRTIARWRVIRDSDNNVLNFVEIDVSKNLIGTRLLVQMDSQSHHFDYGDYEGNVSVRYSSADDDVTVYINDVLKHTWSSAGGGGSSTPALTHSIVDVGILNGSNYDWSATEVRLTLQNGQTSAWTPLPEDLQAIVDAELAMNPAIVLADHDTSELAGTDVRGFVAVGPPAQSIAQLGEIFYFDAVPGNPIRYVPRGQAVVATIANADTGCGADVPGAPFTGLKRGNDVEVPSVVGLKAPNASSDGEPVFRRSDRGITDGPDIRKVETAVYLTAEEAKGRAETMALMARASAHTAAIALSDKYAAAEPGDAYNVTADDDSIYNLLIRRLSYAGGVKAIDWEHNDTSALVFSGITETNYTPSLIVDSAVDSELVPLDIPLLRDADDGAGHYTAVLGSGSADFPGAEVWRSTDDTTFSERIAVHPAEAVIGTAGALGNFTGGYVWDEINSVTVAVGEGQTLASATEEAMQADREINTAALGAHGRWEIIRFRNAVLVSTGVYTLSGLLRGLQGTEDRIGTHVGADVFVLLTTAALRHVAGEVVDIGVLRYLKAVTSGRLIFAATSQEFTNDAVGLRMYSPTNLRAARDGSANITFTFDRRSRLAPRYGGTGGSYVPPAEAGESYEIDVYSNSSYAAVLRTLTGASASIAYSAAQQTADFGSAQATVYARVYAVSAVVGRGAYLQEAA